MRVWWHCALCLALVGAASCQRTEPTASRETESSSTASASNGPAQADPSSSAAQPAYVDVTVPAGTVLSLRLDTPVGSDTSRVEQTVRATLTRAVIIDGQSAVPQGASVSGTVARAVRSGRVKGRAQIALRFSTLEVGTEQYDIQASLAQATAAGTKKKDAAKIGIPAAVGALVGAAAGGGKGAAIGAGVGGGAGTAYVLSTRGEEVRLGRGARLSVKLTMPLHIHVFTRPAEGGHKGERL